MNDRNNLKNSNDIKFIHIPECFNITVVIGNGVSHSFSEHFHHSATIGLITAGEAAVSISKVKRILSERGIYLINPDEIHEISGCGIDYNAISIDKLILTKVTGVDNPIFKTPFIENEKTASQITSCLKTLTDKKSIATAKQESLLTLLAGLPLTESDNIPVQNKNIEKSLEYIKSHFLEDIDLRILSDVSTMSLFHFIRIFKGQTGISPFEFIIQLRIKEACRKLAIGESIADVAADCGFYDQSHFTKYFRKHVGINPKRYISNNIISSNYENG